MKKLVALLFASALIYSCGDGDKKNEPEQTKPADTTAAPAAASTDAGADDEKALTLIGSSDCMTCHAIDRKVIGPAYKDVAKKYEDTPAIVDSLVSKIKHGGSGNWGNLVMTPHPDLPEADAKVMVKYILSLKNK
ncbi:MAG TPA: c-type cytochrome [Flavitalea sp.]|nr:c-type cytochrome [Flavitalea sp.]